MVSSVQVNKSPGFCPLYKEAEEVQQQCLCPRSSGFVEESKICNRSFSEGTAHKKKKNLIFGGWNVFYIHFLAQELPISKTLL